MLAVMELPCEVHKAQWCITVTHMCNALTAIAVLVPNLLQTATQNTKSGHVTSLHLP